jgi:hypothetical protein
MNTATAIQMIQVSPEKSTNLLKLVGRIPFLQNPVKAVKIDESCSMILTLASVQKNKKPSLLNQLHPPNLVQK